MLSVDTNGKFAIIEMEAAPGGGSPFHYHTTFAKTFTAIDGALSVKLRGTKRNTIYPGEEFFVDKYVVHRFWNDTDKPIRFHVRMEPACQGFLDALTIIYGLSVDGQYTPKGIPKNRDHRAIVIKISDTCLSGFYSLFRKALLRRAEKAEKAGIRDQLYRRYCMPVAQGKEEEQKGENKG